MLEIYHLSSNDYMFTCKCQRQKHRKRPRFSNFLNFYAMCTLLIPVYPPDEYLSQIPR